MEAKFHSYDHRLYIVFDDTPAKEPGELMEARRLIKEAGYEFEPYGLTDIVTRKVSYNSQFGPGKHRESIHCDPATLAGAALSLSRDQLANLLAEAFDLYQQAKEQYDAEVKVYQEAAGKRRGRPLLEEGKRRDAFVGATVPPDLKLWADDQPEGTSNLILSLLQAEREKRGTVKS